MTDPDAAGHPVPATAAERVMDVLRWVWCFVYVQFLFVVGTLAGLVVGGVFPAYFAAVFTARGLAEPGAADLATRRYAELYRRLFWKSQCVGWTGVALGLVCASNVIYFHQLQATQPWASAVMVGWLVFTGVLSTAFVLVAPTVVDYDLPLRGLPRLLLAGLGDLHGIGLLVFTGAALGAGLIYQTGLFLWVAAGIVIMVVSALNSSFQRRRLVLEPSVPSEAPATSR